MAITFRVCGEVLDMPSQSNVLNMPMLKLSHNSKLMVETEHSYGSLVIEGLQQLQLLQWITFRVLELKLALRASTR